MSQIPPEMPEERCVFCKTSVEIEPRCRQCGKLLALAVSTPYDLQCPRCKLRRTVGNPGGDFHSKALGNVGGLEV